MTYSSVLITGANRGLGLEFVKQLVKLPTTKQIISVVRDTSNTKEIDELVSNHENIALLKLNVSDFTEHSRFFQQVNHILAPNGLDLLINNAGIFIRSKFHELTADDMIKCYETNTIAPLLLTRTLLPLLKLSKAKSNKQPVVANISSQMGSCQSNDYGEYYPYRCSKAALNMVSKSLSINLKSLGILCVSLHPGWVVTDLGGPKAPITVDVSVSGMLNVLNNISSKVNGNLIDYKGTILPF